MIEKVIFILGNQINLCREYDMEGKEEKKFWSARSLKELLCDNEQVYKCMYVCGKEYKVLEHTGNMEERDFNSEYANGVDREHYVEDET